jgi:perosamine synthetase
LEPFLNSEIFIPLASPDIRQEDIAEIVTVLNSGNLVQGERVARLERSLEQYLRVKHCVVVSNGTASLHLILAALGIGHGDEVIIPAFSYIATANVVELVGATPIFVDIEIDSFNIDADNIVEKITRRTKAVMIVHEFGLSADTQKIKALCDENNIPLIEDAACALGAKEGTIYAGTTGIAGSFSFHPRKAITSGEGGAIVTNSSELAMKVKALRNHGIEFGPNNELDFTYAGFNYRLTDFQAALLISQLRRFDRILVKKDQIARQYIDEISNPQLKLPTVPENKTHAWQTFHVLLGDSKDQKNVISQLKARGVGSNYGAQCMPAQKFFQQKYKLDVREKFPNAMKAYEKGLVVPLYEKLTNDNIAYVVEQINRI